MDLFKYVNLINDKPIHIATVNNENKPNIAVASNVRIIEKNKIIISVNEMVNTQKNIKNNPNVVMTIFNEEWVGLRIFGKAEFYTDGEYYDFCYNTFFKNNKKVLLSGKKLKGAIVVTVEKIEDYK